MKAVKQHLHIGAGSLGLGLICWLTHRAGLRVTIANRQIGSSENSLKRHTLLQRTHFYDVVYRDDIRESVKIDDFVFFDADEEKFSDVVCSPDLLLITISVRENRALDNIVPYLSRALMKRAKSGAAPVYIIACENSLTSSDLQNKLKLYDATLMDYSSLFVFLECVVDRICNEPIIDDSDELFLYAEKFANWVIAQEPSQTLRLRNALLPVTKECVNFVEDVSVYKKRKIWLVNGPHMLITIYLYYQCLRKNIDDPIPVLFEKISDSKDTLTFVLDEAADMFCSAVKSNNGEVRKFIKRVEDRFLYEPDTIARVLKDFKEPTSGDPETLERFIAKIYARVVSLNQESGLEPVIVNRIVGLLTQMIAEKRYIAAG